MTRFWTIAVFMALIAALCGNARAATAHYDATLQADGKTLGVASGTLSINASADEQVSWVLSDGTFTAAALPHATIVFDSASLTGSGAAPAGASIIVKEFNVTLAQSTGVDLTYRFRVTAVLEGDAIRSVEIRQLK